MNRSSKWYFVFTGFTQKQLFWAKYNWKTYEYWCVFLNKNTHSNHAGDASVEFVVIALKHMTTEYVSYCGNMIPLHMFAFLDFKIHI